MTLTKLKELALKATPGPWVRSLVHQYDQTITYIENDNEDIIIETASGIAIDNSRFIIAANPATILALIERYEKLCEKIREAGQANTDMSGPIWDKGKWHHDLLAQFGPEVPLEEK